MAVLATALGAGYYAATTIGINTNTADMFDAKLPWRRDFIEFRAAFPGLTNNLLVVIDAATATAAEDAERRLAKELGREAGRFQLILALESSDFFVSNGLLFLPADELGRLADRSTLFLPLLQQLGEAPTPADFLTLLADVAASITPRPAELTEVVRRLTRAVRDGDREVSWSAAGGPRAQSARRVVLLLPRLDYSIAEPRRAVMRVVRDAAGRIGLTADNGFRVRLTGPVALAAEELQSVAGGMLQGAILTLLLALGILYLALRSWRLVAAAVVTLLVGLVYTGAFVGFAVGHLNLISVAFAVLYIGLGIDFAIHFCLRYQELLSTHRGHHDAINRACGSVGRSIALCAVTTSVGFYSFVPTEFTGMSELGLISGTGMLISLVVTLVLLPALLHLQRPSRPGPRGQFLVSAVGQWSLEHRNLVRLGLVGLAVGAAVLALEARFDSHALALRDPQSESVATFIDLLSDDSMAPSTVHVLVRAERAAATARALEDEPLVARVRSLDDFVPDAQDQRLAVIGRLRAQLAGARPMTLGTGETASQIERVAAAAARLAGSEHAEDRALAAALGGWREWLLQQTSHTAGAGAPPIDADQALDDLGRRLFGALPRQWNRFLAGLEVEAISVRGLPDELRSMWLAPDGATRLEVVPAEPLVDFESQARFVRAVTQRVPTATGLPVVEYRGGQSVVGALRQAFGTALAGVVLLLAAVLRDLRGTLAILVALLLASLMTAAATVVLDLPFNFANVITLPLLLGVGVDNGVHLVHRFRMTAEGASELLASSTSRGIFFSTLTTVASFGTLAFSSHPGTSSMGVLLTVGMLLSMACALVVIPALLPAPARGEIR